MPQSGSEAGSRLSCGFSKADCAHTKRTPMRVLRHTDPDFQESLRSIQRQSVPHPQIERTVRDIVHAVREEGDSALLEFTERFGGPKLLAPQMRVTEKESRKVAAATKKAIAASHDNVSEFAKKSLRKTWKAKNAQ